MEGAHNRGLPSNPTIYTTSPSSDEDRRLVWLVVVHFSCPRISSIPHCCTVSTFLCPSQFVLKMGCFHYVLAENLMQKYGQEGFFPLTYVEPKHQSNSHNQAGGNDIQCLVGYFEYAGYLPCGIKLIVLNYCFNLIAINFNWSSQSWSIIH